MVDITKTGKYVHIEIKGFHKLWAFRNSITVPREHILNVYQNELEVENLGGLRMLGTSIPYGICAGYFLTPDGPVFCDLTNKKNAIIITLKDEYFKKLIVEVEAPLETIYFLAKG
jgi:hypothetical protein